MGNSTYKCYRTLHSRSQHQVVFELKQDVHDEQDDVEADVMARWKHEVYKMTLLEGAYVDSDTKKLSVCYGYRTLCSATLQDRLLTIVFCCSKWQELWDITPELLQEKRYVYRWVAAVTDCTEVIVPFTYQWRVKKLI